MKILMMLSLFFIATQSLANTNESCRAEIGLIQAEKLVQVCQANGIDDCNVAQKCSNLIIKSCQEIHGNEGMDFFNCGQSMHNEFVVDFSAHQTCTEIAPNDEMAYFTCRVHLYNGNSPY